MKKMIEYVIPFGGLKMGEHIFNYVIDKNFLQKFENEEVRDSNIEVEVKMIKHNRLLEFYFDLKGSAVVECDRCLDDMEIEVLYDSKLIVKLENVEDEEDEIVFIKPEETEIDISKYIYENIIFSIPLRKVHEDDENGNSTCNKEMLKKLEDYIINKSDIDEEDL